MGLRVNGAIERVLVVGLGSIGRRHIRVVRELCSGIKIIVLRHKQCDDNDIETLGLHRCVTTIEDALAFQPEVAIVANPATKHLEVATQLAEAGVHLLIEKPIAASPEGVQDLIDLCKKKKIFLMTAYNLRFLPSMKEFRKQVQQEKVGKIYSVRAEVGQHLFNWRPENDYRKTVAAQKRLGGGVLLELSHEIDYLSWIFGSIEWVKSHVYKQSDLEIDVEDTANIILGFENQSGDQLVATLNMDFIRHDTTRQCVVIGERGSLRWDGITGEVQYFPGGEQGWEELYSGVPERDYTYMKEIKHFFSSVESGKSPLVSGENGLEVVFAIEAIHKPSHKGSLVYLQHYQG